MAEKTAEKKEKNKLIFIKLKPFQMQVAANCNEVAIAFCCKLQRNYNVDFCNLLQLAIIIIATRTENAIDHLAT